ncbi:hypothetical protein [Xanthomonas translucens]|uniref:hypothetical protein n=1 Tax=Xanthomonas campestris pv. translucens TaxID=343 RepID=UPI001F602B1D|nr:hypothetical protein [Xanthomonas translucens]UNU01216.1 hypothetical protein KBQ49_20155 [Xanthomonas translucens pv. translucens]
MRLVEIVRSLPPDTLRRLSRLRIEHGPGTARVVMHIAGGTPCEPVGLHPLPGGGMDVRSIPRGPVSASSKQGVAARNPPVRLQGWDAMPEICRYVDIEALDAQIEQLHDSRIVGRLNTIVRQRYTLIYTSAGSDAERADWVRSIDRDGTDRPVYDETQDAPQYVSISGDTYPYRRRIVRLSIADRGFARWHKASQTWRAKLAPASIKALRALNLTVDVIDQSVAKDP